MLIKSCTSRTALDAISQEIEEKTGCSIERTQQAGASGWSSQMIFTATDGQKFFVKTSSQPVEDMFLGESQSLAAMYGTNTLCVPKVVSVGSYSGGSYLATDYLDFGGRGDQARMGEQLAKMHAAQPQHGDGKFGFPVDNTIGGTPQPNGWDPSWVNFFREKRLMHQVELTGNRRLIDLGKAIADNLDVLFEGITVTPALLHGDLWSGNMAYVNGKPAVFDPASYYGHSEAEFGMSWCAGFSNAFYTGYFSVMPQQPGFQQRRDLYLAYHYLNHYNLFGSGYLGESERLLKKIKKAVE